MAGEEHKQEIWSEFPQSSLSSWDKDALLFQGSHQVELMEKVPNGCRMLSERTLISVVKGKTLAGWLLRKKDLQVLELCDWSRPVSLKAWFLNWRHQHHVEFVRNATSQAPPWTGWIRMSGGEPSKLDFNKPPSGFWCSQAWEPLFRPVRFKV